MNKKMRVVSSVMEIADARIFIDFETFVLMMAPFLKRKIYRVGRYAHNMTTTLGLQD
ncbi:MAG: hypothetical protein WAX69_11865 [Victivallales bacterium]